MYFLRTWWQKAFQWGCLSSGEGLMLKEKDAFQSCLVALTHGTMWSFHLTSSLDEWTAPREAHSVPCFAGMRMLLNDSSLHCSAYCFTKLCSDWNSQGQSYSLATGGEKWNMWWKCSKGLGQLGQATNPTGQLFLPASPALLRQLCHSGGTAVTDLLRLWHCHCPAFPALSICPPILSSLSPWTAEFGLRIAGLGGYSACRKGMLGGLVAAYSFLLEEWQDCGKRGGISRLCPPRSSGGRNSTGTLQGTVVLEWS